MASPDDRRDPDGWRRWRFELAAYGKYVELSFEDVAIGSTAEVRRWARELSMALEHYLRPVDLLLDLRGVHVDEACGERCGKRLLDILQRHAATVSYHGADESTGRALRPALEACGAGEGGRDRDEALAVLMAQRERRLATAPSEGSDGSGSGSGSGKAWARSESTGL